LGQYQVDELYARFPSLADSTHKITSEDTDEYNCTAWVERDFHHWYEPGIHWPDGVPEPESDDDDLHCYIALFESWGFERCRDGSHEPGYLKIALYSVGSRYFHVAKQIRHAEWSSKAGVLHDFRHESLGALKPSVLMDNAEPTVFMRRPDDGTDAQHLERGGLIPL
jgi:hypothetical protein